MKVNLIKGADALVKFIDGIAARGKKLDGDIHIAAVSATAHFAEHGDVTYINRLYTAMPKGARHVALTEWFLQFAGVMANDGASKKTSPFLKDAAKKVNLDEGTKKPWFLLKPSKTPDDVVDILALTLKVIAKAQAEGKQIVNEAMLPELQALVEKHAPAATDADGEPGANTDDAKAALAGQ